MLSLDNQELDRIGTYWRQSRIGLLYLDVARFSEWEHTHGRAYCEHVLSSMKTCIQQLQGDLPSILKVKNMGDDFYFFIALKLKQSEELQRKELLELGSRVKLELERLLRMSAAGVSAELAPMELHMGMSLLPAVAPGGRSGGGGGRAKAAAPTDIDKMIYMAVKQAIREARRQETVGSNAEAAEFLAIMERERIRSVYQPIVSLEDAQIFGYEALTRGPEGSVFHSPIRLFQFAEQENMLYMLDRLAREKAVSGCSGLDPSERVFINIPAHVIHDPQFTPGQTLKLLEKRGLKPHNVVFEITERSSIEDFSTTKKLLQHYRSQGYQIAIDDAGAGYSSLQAIAELQPDFIKVDRSLIQDIHTDKIKEYILETFVSFAEKMNIRIIAEGIEKLEELTKLIQMGVHYGQGYLIARPSPEMMPIDRLLADSILRQRRWRSFGGSTSIGSLAVPLQSFSPETHISEVANYFKLNVHVSGAVITSRDIPVGLTMRDKLFQQLAGQYGLSLYWSRPISTIMDAHPLIAEETMSIEQVSQMATSRDIHQLYDYVVITTDGRYLGAASVRSILESITKAKLEYARIANPLTGLPGNVQIQKELAKRLAEQQPFSVIYADLDYFKWFNDRYGFHKGDQMIQFTADILQLACRVCGHPYDFVGHIGGDDFIVMTNAEEPMRVCEEMIRQFDSGVLSFYELGGIEVLDREGNPVDAEGVSMSLSLVICEWRADLTAERISQEAANLKKQAKAYRGSITVYRHLREAGSAPAGAIAALTGAGQAAASLAPSIAESR
ncbi:bifunctional diguanylate cyclase/phosphodiesterase [Paenibacillus koleovorans]|uniref:bifunctional diguanylate cyclase/phosphodiesterase n=1 Tax=Paenibacillus koleovorans TaxID=121608 RepID=UPI000FD796A1|nr:bifunctional diguanylate cyclase/phosphodiesterase [Paenibacillus koleovorans]